MKKGILKHLTSLIDYTTITHPGLRKSALIEFATMKTIKHAKIKSQIIDQNKKTLFGEEIGATN